MVPGASMTLARLTFPAVIGCLLPHAATEGVDFLYHSSGRLSTSLLLQQYIERDVHYPKFADKRYQ